MQWGGNVEMSKFLRNTLLICQGVCVTGYRSPLYTSGYVLCFFAADYCTITVRL